MTLLLLLIFFLNKVIGRHNVFPAPWVMGVIIMASFILYILNILICLRLDRVSECQHVIMRRSKPSGTQFCKKGKKGREKERLIL